MMANHLGLVLRSRKRARRIGRPTQPLHPVVLVPGILGTALLDPEADHFPVWGSYRGAFFYRDRYEDLDQSILENVRNRLVPGEPLWSFPVVPRLFSIPVYEELGRTLEGLGYERAPLSRPLQNGLYGLAYDWRQGVLAGARALENAVDHLSGFFGKTLVTLIGHSFGSLVARYYLRYGGADITAGETPRPGAPFIATVFSIGAPFAGSIRAFEELNQGFLPGPVGRAISPHHIASNPVAYQLIRHQRDFAVDTRGDPLDLDLGDVATWERLGFGAFNKTSLERLHHRAQQHRRELSREESKQLARALIARHLQQGRRLSERLRAPDPLDASVTCVTYAAANLPTLSKAILEISTPPIRAAFNCEQAKAWPALAEKLTVPGDGYISLEEVRGHAGAAREVHRAEDIPDCSYLFVADARSHRNLLKADAFLTNLANHLAHAKARDKCL